MLDRYAFSSYTGGTPTRSKRSSDRQLRVIGASPPPPRTVTPQRQHEGGTPAQSEFRPRLHAPTTSPLTVLTARRTLTVSLGQMHAATTWLASPRASFGGNLRRVDFERHYQRFDERCHAPVWSCDAPACSCSYVAELSRAEYHGENFSNDVRCTSVTRTQLTGRTDALAR